MPWLDKLFFCNSGTEAVEAAIKFSRAATGRARIVYCEHAFHGLSYGALSLCGDQPFRDRFGPFVGACTPVPFDDLAALEQIRVPARSGRPHQSAHRRERAEPWRVDLHARMSPHRTIACHARTFSDNASDALAGLVDGRRACRRSGVGRKTRPDVPHVERLGLGAVEADPPDLRVLRRGMPAKSFGNHGERRRWPKSRLPARVQDFSTSHSAIPADANRGDARCRAGSPDRTRGSPR